MAATRNAVTILNETDPRFSVTGVLVAAGAVATIAAGSPTKSADAATAATGAVVPLAAAGNTAGTIAVNFTGIAKNDSNETAAVAGTVNLWLPLPGYVYSCVAKTASAINTVAKLITYFRRRVLFDCSASNVWTVDTEQTDQLVNCVTIVGGDFRTSTVYFTYKNAGTILDQHQTS
ncbi:MAG: hypothetical protein WCO06_01500 [Candidatus Roizmanbacteria bacterium]